jgi:predicted phosphodiesterase
MNRELKMDNLIRKENESTFEWKLRLCKLKINKEIDLDWQEIVDVLGIEVHPDHLLKTAYGLLEYDNYIKNNGVTTRILSISDTHVPFQLPIETYKDYRGQVDILQLNGDIVDMQAISKFPKSYRVSVMEEIIQGRQYIIDLIEYINPKKVVVTYGNHDIRFQNYLSKNLDSDLLELMPQTVLDLIFIDGFNHYDKRSKTKTNYEPLQKVFKDIEINYTENWFCQIGETIFCHPSAFSTGILKTAEKAMYFFRNEGYIFKSLVMAHTHRVGEYTIGNTTIYEQGACCDTKKMNYSDGKLTNSQKEGFIFICQDDNGNVIKDKTKLVVLN